MSQEFILLDREGPSQLPTSRAQSELAAQGLKVETDPRLSEQPPPTFALEER